MKSVGNHEAFIKNVVPAQAFEWWMPEVPACTGNIFNIYENGKKPSSARFVPQAWNVSTDNSWLCPAVEVRTGRSRSAQAVSGSCVPLAALVSGNHLPASSVWWERIKFQFNRENWVSAGSALPSLVVGEAAPRSEWFHPQPSIVCLFLSLLLEGWEVKPGASFFYA